MNIIQVPQFSFYKASHLELEQLRMFNVNGKRFSIKSNGLNDNETEISIDISALPAGIYFIKHSNIFHVFYKY